MYIPIMKNRTVEVSVLQQLSGIHVFDDSVIPLVELIQAKTRSNNKTIFLQDLAQILNENPKMHVMLDFYKSSKLRSTTETISEYVTQSVRQPQFCIEQLLSLSHYKKQVIPVISYLVNSVDLDRITLEAEAFRPTFPRLAFRVKIQEFDRVFPHIESLATSADFIILDIDNAAHSNPMFKKIYKVIEDSKKKIKYTSIIVNAHRPENLANKDMPDGQPIADIDNSLKELYSTSYMHHFDGFGDYACIAASLPTTGGAISPVGIFYSNENNYFISFRGRAPLLSEFPEYIAPSIIRSEYWNEYSETHHQHCPGCNEISSINARVLNGKNQAQWKKITMLHYIYTMYEVKA